MEVKTTEAQKRAKQKYMEKYVEVKVRMTPEKRDIVKVHADNHDNGSATAFINRAIDETMERDSLGIEDIPITKHQMKPDGKGGWIETGIKEIEVPLKDTDEQSGSPEQLISSANRGLKTAERSLNAIFDLAHDEKFRTQLKALLPEKLSGLDPQVLYDRIVGTNIEWDKSADK